MTSVVWLWRLYALWCSKLEMAYQKYVHLYHLPQRQACELGTWESGRGWLPLTLIQIMFGLRNLPSVEYICTRKNVIMQATITLQHRKKMGIIYIPSQRIWFESVITKYLAPWPVCPCLDGPVTVKRTLRVLFLHFMVGLWLLKTQKVYFCPQNANKRLILSPLFLFPLYFFSICTHR